MRKVVGLKKFHCFMVTSGICLKFRFGTCCCSSCLKADYTACVETSVYGEWVGHDITKPQDLARANHSPHISGYSENNEEEEEEEEARRKL